MKAKQIFFVDVGKAGILEVEQSIQDPHEVLVRDEYTVISAGTERANIMDMPNTFAYGRWPKQEGYAGVGIVKEVGSAVTSVKPGDRVIVYFGKHRNWNVMKEEDVIKITDDSISSLDAVHTMIAHIALHGVRKARISLGESVMIMGMGPLGVYGVQLAKWSGAVPLIAADLKPERRALALELGADYALDPAAPNFAQQVLDLTGGVGVNAVVEGTGNAIALKQALSCVAKEGRVSLLGCTRIPDVPIDFYKEVHSRCVELIGAHTCVRPTGSSRRDAWTYRDDIVAVLKMIGGKRLRTITSEIHTPDEAETVFHRLSYDPEFPIGVVFDWRNFD